MSVRDISLEETFDLKFTTRQFSDGVPTTASGLTIAAYPGNSTTEITAGITTTFTSGFDARAGLVNVRVVATAANGYATATDYALVVTAGTVGGVSIVGEVVGEFTIGRSAAATRLGVLTATAATGDPGTTTGVIAYLKQLVNVLVGTAGVTTWATGAAPANAVSLSESIRYISDNLGAVGTAAATGDPTSAKTVMGYTKQLVNVLVGSDGVATFPAEAAPGNAVSLAEVIRAIHADVTGLNGATTTTIGTQVWATTTRQLTGTQTFNVTGNITGNVSGSVGSVTGAVGSVTGSVGSVVGHTAQTGDCFARLGAPAGASVSADVAAVKAETALIVADTNELQTDDIPGTLATLATAAALATVDTVVDGIQADLDNATDGLGAIKGDTAAILTDTGTTLDSKLNDIQGATFNTSTDSLEAIRDRGDAAWTTGGAGSDRLLMVDTTIATLSTQTSFTLTAGSDDDNAYQNCTIVIEDASTATQKAVGLISAYTGSTKTVTLKYDPGIFTMAVTDKVYILAENSLKSTAANRQLDVTATGAAGIDWGNVENPTTAVDLSGTDIQLCDTVTTLNGHTAQTGDTFALANGVNGFSAIKSDTFANNALLGDVLTDTGTTLDTKLNTLTTNLSTAQTAIDAIQTDLDNGTDGLGALKTLIDTVNTDLSNGTDGLGALKTLIDAIQTDLDNPTDGLGALKTLVDTVNTDLSNGTDGLGALKTLIDAIKVITDALGSTAAANLALSAGVYGIVVGAAEAGTLSTTQMTTDLAEATDDHFIGRVVIWTSGVLAGQASAITDYAGATGELTYVATTESPSAADTFIIV